MTQTPAADVVLRRSVAAPEIETPELAQVRELIATA